MSDKTITRPQRRVPIGCEVDVVVAGAGTSGLMAALAAAGQGARVALVDRMMALGGNFGPGMIGGATVGMTEADAGFDAAYKGVCGRFYKGMRAAMDDMPETYSVTSHAASYVAIQMCREAGIEVILSAYAADPIMEGSRVAGLFVETKSGTIAIPAKVVVDATGDADIARRAGAAMHGDVSAQEVMPDGPLRDWATAGNPAFRRWNDGQVFFYLGEAEFAKYDAFCQTPVELTADQRHWADEHLRLRWKPWPDAMIPILKDGWETGEFVVEREVRHNVIVGLNNWFPYDLSRADIMGGRAGIFGEYDTGDWRDVSMMEIEVRNMVVDGVRYFRKKKVPGFERAFVLCMSPFLGARGGPFIEGEYTLTPLEAYHNARFPDVCLARGQHSADGRAGGYDWPYRVLLPKRIDGLLVTGRGASFVGRGHDWHLRGRTNMAPLGEAAGLAAALAVKDGVQPRDIDVKKLQRAMLAGGYRLGDQARLKELGLA